MRACEHITRRIYSGRICEKVLHRRKAIGNHILITERPADPRCRLWPWQNPDHLLYKKNGLGKLKKNSLKPFVFYIISD